jgi:intermediate peptidase
LEYFVWDHRVLGQWAKHWKTGEPIPESLVEGLRQSKYMFSALDTQLQVLYARFDQEVHGMPPPASAAETSGGAGGGFLSGALARLSGGGGGAGAGARVDSTAILKELQNKHTSIPYADDTYWHSRFGHIVGYGAGYYSYLYARVFAAQVWKKCFADDPLNREVGVSVGRRGRRVGGAGRRGRRERNE